MNGRHARMRRWIEQELLGTLSWRHREQLREHLRANARARAEYDRAVEAFRVLEERDPARAEIDLVERWLFEGHAHGVETRPSEGASRFGRLWAIVAVTAAAAAAAVLVLRMPVDPEPDDAMAVRDASSRRPGLAIEALCGPNAAAGLQPAVVSGCPLSGTLAFAYRVDPSAGLAGGALTLFGIDEAGQVSYYAPTPVDREPIEIRVGQWQPLPLSIALAVNHTAGRQRLYAVVTPVSLDVADVDEAADILRSQSSARTRAPWITRLGGLGRIAQVCARPQACLSAELTFRVHEDSP